MGISYKCSFCENDNYAEDHRAGDMRECRSCGKLTLVPGGGSMGVLSSQPALKTCPHCAEKDLQQEARVCKHCGKKLDDSGFGCLFYSAVFCLFIGAFFFPALILPGIALGILVMVLRS